MSYRAIRHAREASRRNTPIAVGTCLLQVRTAMGIPAGGDWDGDGDADAEDAWKRAQHKRHVNMDDPARDKLLRGAPVFWLGGSHDNGHVAIATGYGRGQDATVWSPGVPGQPARWRKVAVGVITAGWGLTGPVGYTLDLNGHPVPDLERG